MDTKTFKEYLSYYDVICIEYAGHEYTVTDIEYPSESYGKRCFDCFCIDKDGEIVNDDRTFRVESVDDISESSIDDEDDTSMSRIIYLSRQYDAIFMGYTNAAGEYHEMNISDIEYPSEEYGEGYFEAFCIDDNGEPEARERTFKISRIDFIQPSDLDLEYEDEEEEDEEDDEYEEDY